MAYSDEAVKAKLAALSETQDSIVTVAQWIMFHRYAHCVIICHQAYTNIYIDVTLIAPLHSG